MKQEEVAEKMGKIGHFESPFTLLSFLALVAFGVWTLVTLLAFLAFLALFAFACNISVGGTRAFAFP